VLLDEVAGILERNHTRCRRLRHYKIINRLRRVPTYCFSEAVSAS
jgi:hypothetical protein